MREMVESQMRGAALKLALELMQQEVERLCGTPFSRKGTEKFHRGGSDPGSIIFHGQRMKVKKPRVRHGGDDIQLETYAALQNYDMLCDEVQRHMLAGVSTRDYDGLCEDVAEGTGLSKSAVSEAFVRASQGALGC
jgi:putative transposase